MLLETDWESVIQSLWGETDWVLNLRAAETATLRRGEKTVEFRPEELTLEEAGRFYKEVLPGKPRMIRSRFDIADDAPLEDYVRMAADHPIFRIARTGS